MKHKAAILLMCVATTLAQAQHNDIIDLNEDTDGELVAKQVQTYYQHPDVKHAFELSNQLIDLPVFETQSQARLNTWLWGAQIIKQHPFRTRSWCKKMKEKHQHADIAPFFQFADTSSAKRCLKSLELTESERYELSQLPDLKEPLNRELLSPSDLDVLWTTFFATGNPQAIHKLVDLVINHQANNRNQNQNLTYMVARWSLQSNMKQDAQIRKIVNDYVRSLAPSQQQFAKNSLDLS